MKTLLKIILILIAIPLIIAAFVGNDLVYEKTIHINAPIDSVWEHTNSLSDLDSWSPWNRKDPNMKKELSGIDGTIGAMESWEGEVEEVGKGNQTISKIEAPYLFETDLHFYEPQEMISKGYIKLKESNGGTDITWGFRSEMSYPFNLFLLIMDMEEHMGEDWNYALATLKDMCESELN